MTYNYIGGKEPIIAKLIYWRDYNGTGDEYRRSHDSDCVLCGGDLNADTIFSLWLPLRYTLNHFNKPMWQYWRELEYAELRPKGIRLKDHAGFLDSIIENIDDFLPDERLTQKLSTLFDLGQQRCNVMLLPKREWNTLRGRHPYWDYFPHFLYDLFSHSLNDVALHAWIKNQRLELFFSDKIVARENLLDLAGTGSVCRHNPRDIKVEYLIENYIEILHQRKELLATQAA